MEPQPRLAILAYRHPQGTRSRALPPYTPPETRPTPTLVLGESHFARTPGRAPAPTWLTIPQRGLYTGVMVLGAVGSGKTSACMYPYVQQLLRWRAHDPAQKLGGLVLEVKGDFCTQVRRIANAFLSDPTQRALVHPAPTQKRCYLATDYGRVLFDANMDEAPARDVPIEAHRRFRADLRARREQNLKTRAEQLVLHEEKKRYIAEWVVVHGTPDQRARQAAGVLPMDEAIEAITDDAFRTLADRQRYCHDGVERVQKHLRQVCQHSDAVVTREELVVTSADAKEMNAAQWEMVQEIRRLLPEATVTLRIHKLAWKRDTQAPTLTVCGVLVTSRVGPFTLRREYASPGE